MNSIRARYTVNLYSFRNICSTIPFREDVEEVHIVPDDYSIVGGDEVGSGKHRLSGIRRALISYLNDVRTHSKILARERAEFELGKRHLANMMSLDPAGITQEDIDKAILYLFPSGLTEPLAQPLMKPPEEILPKFRAHDFDEEGRPKHSLFYTIKPKFYQLLSDIGNKTKKLLHQSGKYVAIREADDSALLLGGTFWLSKDKLSKVLDERISDEMYSHFVTAADYLASLPNVHLEGDFIMSYRTQLVDTRELCLFGPQIPNVEVLTEQHRRRASVVTRVKTTEATTTVLDSGSGKYFVMGHGLEEFRYLQSREIFLTPLILADLLGKVDVSAELVGVGGQSVVPRVVRHGVSLCIAALYPEVKEKLRLAGLLTTDPRRKERKKINQPGARAKWIWKKR